MTIELAGIVNENEFYSNHYLTTVLEGDIREAVANWADAEGRAPPKLLDGLAARWIATAGDYVRTRDAGARVAASRDFADRLLNALGYLRRAETRETLDRKLIPVLAATADGDGSDRIWILEALAPSGDDFDTSDVLANPFACELYGTEVPKEDRAKQNIDIVLTKGVLPLDNAPRFIIVLSLSEAVLIDRNKWARRALLRFDLGEIFRRRSDALFQIIAVLLHQESLCPRSGTALIDRIEEESHRHANAISGSLKSRMREAIELLGNEVLEVTGGSVAGKRIDEKALTRECLRFMYRLLFLFYIEARRDLGFAPINAESYAKGYSLEALRELEMRPIRTKADEDGFFIWDSLKLLFKLMFEGTPQLASGNGDTGSRKDFYIEPVKVELLDPASTPILSRVRLRNRAMQRIVRLLSLSEGDRDARVGRISYAQIGIAQLGAVYETLLSFTGFIARQPLVEVQPIKTKKKDEQDDSEDDGEAHGKPDEGDVDDEEADEEDASTPPGSTRSLMDPAWFVPVSRFKPTDGSAPEITAEEVVYDGGQPRIYKEGRFVYRLAGRDRANTASYYTPEPLARLLVKHALEDLLKDKPADEILELRVCEPAMGSAAFLVETVNQLADAYLDRKQREIDRTIPQDQYEMERQRVRAYIADRNCFGIDLNPTAVELGQVSLWLNCLHTGGHAPWFWDQLHAGNSLIGARRAVYPIASLKRGKGTDLWFDTVPREVGWRRGHERRPEEVWHFLLPSSGMASFYSDTDLLDFAGEEQAEIKAWRRGTKNAPRFFGPFDDEEIATVERLSRIVDRLFDEVAAAWEHERRFTNDQIAIWPTTGRRCTTTMTYVEKRFRIREMQGSRAGNTLPYKRLKTAMDAWCALWFWPLDKSRLLPSRTEFLLAMSFVLEGVGDTNGKPTSPAKERLSPRQSGLFETVSVPGGSSALFETRDVPAPQVQITLNVVGREVDDYVAMTPWLELASEVAARHRFVHFDLLFADVLKEREGFDLIVGNPPWVKPEWNDLFALGDLDPVFIVRKKNATEISNQKKAFLLDPKHPERLSRYLDGYVAARGMMAFTVARDTMPFLGGGQNNLYKCFIDLSWRLLGPKGRAALIHQDSHLVDPKAGAFRTEWYHRIVKHMNFRNQIKTKMFSDVHNNTIFSVNVYRGQFGDISFSHISGALLPSVVDDSFSHDGVGEVPEIKRPDGRWDTRGHARRFVHIDATVLAIMHDLNEEVSTPIDQTRFIMPHSQDTLAIFRAMSMDAIGFSEGAGTFKMERLWDESGTQKKNLKVIKRETGFQSAPREMILTGPLLYVGNPFYKTLDRVVRSNKSTEVIELAAICDDYLPRTNYKVATDWGEYTQHLTRCRWDPTKSHVDQYRIAFRNMLPPQNERTLIGALIPPGVAHVDTVESLAFQNEEKLVVSYPAWISLPFDFLVKSISMTHFREASLRHFPWVDAHPTAQHRALRLACLTQPYADIWNRQATRLEALPWSSDDRQLGGEGSVHGPARWDRTAGLRTDFARRLALVEIDVLVAMALGLALDHLIDMYRIHFAVLKQNEAGTWYDKRGQIVWTCSKGLPRVGFLVNGRSPSRSLWERECANLSAGALECEAVTDFLPGGPHLTKRIFEAPFTRCDRIEDYRRAWAHFERLGVRNGRG